MKKVTKREIANTLRTRNVTKIFRLAHRCGVDASDKGAVHRFIKDNAPSQMVCRSAYRLSYGAADFKNFRCYRGGFENVENKSPISEAIKFARMQKENGWMATSYGKILFIGNRNIYWCHPGYGHADYNKGIALENTPKNRRVANLINAYLGHKTK